MTERDAVRTKYGAEISTELDDANEIELTIEIGTGYEGAQATVTWQEAEKVASKLMSAADAAHRALAPDDYPDGGE
jgi:hypothetical protein